MQTHPTNYRPSTDSRASYEYTDSAEYRSPIGSRGSHIQARFPEDQPFTNSRAPIEHANSAGYGSYVNSGASYNQVPASLPPWPGSGLPGPGLQEANVNNRAEELLRNQNELLRAQLRDIQRERLSALDDFQPCSDAELMDAFLQVQNQVTSLSRQLRSSLSKSQNSVSVLQGHMLSACPTMKVSTKYVLESFLWQQLWMRCLYSPFVMLGPNGDIIYQAWCLIFNKGKQLIINLIPFCLALNNSLTGDKSDFEPSEASERWRSITATEMFRISNRSRRIAEVTKALLSGIASLDSQILKNLTNGDQLLKLIGRAWDLAALFSQQRCRLCFPQANTIENLTSDWAEVVEEVQCTEDAAFSISPALFKRGTSHGQNLDTWLCLVNAKSARIRAQ